LNRAAPGRRRQGEELSEIEGAPRVWQECAMPDWTRRFIRGFGRGCKVRVKPGSHHRTQPLKQDSMAIEDAETETPKGARAGETWKSTRRRGRGKEDAGQPGNSTAGTAGRCRTRGNPKTHREGGAGRTRFGVTRRLSASNAEGCERRGNSKLHRRRSRKMQDSGIPGDSSGGEAGSEEPGRPGTLKMAAPKESERRGNSKLDRRRSRKMRQSGQPEDSSGSAAGSEDAGQPGTSWRAVLKDARETRKLESPIAGADLGRGNGATWKRANLEPPRTG